MTDERPARQRQAPASYQPSQGPRRYSSGGTSQRQAPPGHGQQQYGQQQYAQPQYGQQQYGQPYGQGPYGQGPQGPPPGYGRPPHGHAPQTSTKAILSIVFSIVGFMTLPVILHVVGIILGHSAKTEIQQDPALEGESLANAGIIIGWVGIVVSVLVFLLMFLLVFGMAAVPRFGMVAGAFINPWS